jgi:hypothetical protein
MNAGSATGRALAAAGGARRRSRRASRGRPARLQVGAASPHLARNGGCPCGSPLSGARPLRAPERRARGRAAARAPSRPGRRWRGAVRGCARQRVLVPRGGLVLVSVGRERFYPPCPPSVDDEQEDVFGVPFLLEPGRPQRRIPFRWRVVLRNPHCARSPSLPRQDGLPGGNSARHPLRAVPRPCRPDKSQSGETIFLVVASPGFGPVAALPVSARRRLPIALPV